jgi:hypothetical protein
MWLGSYVYANNKHNRDFLEKKGIVSHDNVFSGKYISLVERGGRMFSNFFDYTRAEIVIEKMNEINFMLAAKNHYKTFARK